MALYDIPIHTLQGDDATLGDYKGKTLLLVNVASKCGLTPQYEGLERLQKTYGDRGFSVIGFPCNQFMGQEPGTSEEIAQFCSATYGVTFPLMEKIDVNGDDRSPIYAELTEKEDAEGNAGDITWNFEKFLVSPEGDVVARYRPQVEPEDADGRRRHRGAADRLTPPHPVRGVRRVHLRHGRAPHRLRDPLARGRDRDPRWSRRPPRRRGLPLHQGHVRGRGHRALVRAAPVAGRHADARRGGGVDRRPGHRAHRDQGRAQAGRARTPSTCAAARGLPLAVASSSQYRLIDAALAHFGLRDRFELVHSAEDEEYGKPHPAVFLSAAAKLGAPPRRCLVWEDAPAGVLAAKASSMTCIAVPEQGEGDQPAFGLADLVVDSLLDVTGASLDALEQALAPSGSR